MIKRTPDHFCMLCQLRKADKTGSHFVPAGLLKGTIGKRDYEEAYSIDVKEGSTSSFYGRSNLKNTSTEQAQNPHTHDYIFCSECEKNLGKLENEIIPILNTDVYNIKKSTNYSDIVISTNASVRTLNRVNTNLFNLLVYSLVWRISIQQRLEGQSIPVSARFDRVLQGTLNANIEMEVSDIEKTAIDFDHPYTIITCDEIEDSTATFVNPNVVLTNPQLFYIGTYLVLIHHNECSEQSKISKLPPEVLDKGLRNDHTSGPIKVVKVSKEVWDEVNAEIVEYTHKKFCENMAINFAKKKGISLQEAGRILQAKTDELLKTHKSDTFIEALSEFCNNEVG